MRIQTRVIIITTTGGVIVWLSLCPSDCGLSPGWAIVLLSNLGTCDLLWCNIRHDTLDHIVMG